MGWLGVGDVAANWWSGVLDTVTNVVTNRVIRV